MKNQNNSNDKKLSDEERIKHIEMITDDLKALEVVLILQGYQILNKSEKCYYSDLKECDDKIMKIGLGCRCYAIICNYHINAFAVRAYENINDLLS